MLVVVASLILASFWMVLIQSQATGSCKIRGSFCITYFSGRKQVVIALEAIRVTCAIAPLNFSVVISLILYCKKVKSSVVNFDRAILGSILRLFVVLAGGSFVWNSPTLVMHFGSFDGTQRSFIELLSSFTLQFNFVLFPLLTLFLHKEVRGPFMAVFSFLMPNSHSPPPVEQSASESHKSTARGVPLAALSDPLVQMRGASLVIANPTASSTVQENSFQLNQPPSELVGVQHSSVLPTATPLSISADDSDTVSSSIQQPFSAAITQQPSSTELADRPSSDVNSKLATENPHILDNTAFEFNSETNSDDFEPPTTTNPQPRVPSAAALSVTNAEVLATNAIESGASETNLEIPTIENEACKTEMFASNAIESGVSGTFETKAEANEAWVAEIPIVDPFNSGSHSSTCNEKVFTPLSSALAGPTHQVDLPTSGVSDIPMGMSPPGSINFSDTDFKVIDLEATPPH